MFRTVCLSTFALFFCLGNAYAIEPTAKDVKYSTKYDRSVLDVWSVKSESPTPLVVYFHGGGFRNGDKAHFNRSQFLKIYHPKGVAFASVNYPFLKHINNDYLGILKHCTEAIKHLKENAKQYNIDPERISVMGTSAGALISCYLGHGTEEGICSVFGHLQPIGTNLLTTPFLKKDGPPIVLYNKVNPRDKLHAPENAALVKKRCQQLGVYAEAYGTDLSDLPDGKDIHDVVMEVFYKSWKMDFPS